MGKQGLQREMDSFFRETENEDFSIRRITKGGFSKSRRNLAWRPSWSSMTSFGAAFISRSITWVIMGISCWLWMERSSTCLNHESIHQEFGIRDMGRGGQKQGHAQKHVSALNALRPGELFEPGCADGQRTDGSELQLLLKHLPKIDKGDIVMLDQVTPSRYLFSILTSKGSHFIVRMKPNWVPVKEFIKSHKGYHRYDGSAGPGTLERYRKEFPAIREKR